MNHQTKWQIDYHETKNDFKTGNKELSFNIHDPSNRKIWIVISFEEEMIDDNPKLFQDNVFIKYALFHIKDAIKTNEIFPKIILNHNHVSKLKEYSSKNLEDFFEKKEENIFVLKTEA